MKYQKLLFFLQNVGKDPSALILDDELTGLKNRRYLFHHFKNEVDWKSLQKQPLSLVMMDIDHFKRINDQYGPETGDRSLLHIAEILKKVSGKRGIPIRYAGDSFMILLPGRNKPEALSIAAELVHEMHENLYYAAEVSAYIEFTFSIGVATAPDDAGNTKTLIAQADTAMYYAKQSGRNRYADAGSINREAVFPKIALHSLESAGIAGRKSQLEQVSQVLQKVGDGQSRFAIVDGAPGMGKTSFLDTIHRNLEKTSLNPIRVTGNPQETYRPYYLISYIVMALMNQREDKGIGVLEAMEEKEVALLATILPQLASTEIHLPSSDSPEQREAAFKVFNRFLCDLADNRPLILLIDDLHYADPATLHLLRVVFKEQKVLLFVCATASEDVKAKSASVPLELFRTAYAEELEIDDIQMTPLSAGDIHHHINLIFPSISLPKDLTREIAEISKGSPLFIVEILRKMVSDRKIVQSRRKWTVSRLEKGYFPRSLDEIIQQKMATLDNDSKGFLDRASAFGETTSLSMLAGSTNEKSAKVYDYLNQALAQGIVRSDFMENDESIRFSSKQVREIVYDGIDPDQRKILHEQIGHYQEKLYQQEVLPSAAFLAHHFGQSDNVDKAREYSQLQSDLNQSIFNPQELMAYMGEVSGEAGKGDDEAAGGTGEEIARIPVSVENMRRVPSLLRSLLVAVRNLRLYPSDSRSVSSAIEQFMGMVSHILETEERVSIISEKKSVLINGQSSAGNEFLAVADMIVDLWDRLELKSLTFIRGVAEPELVTVLTKIAHTDRKKIKPGFWSAFKKEKALSHLIPRQIEYKKIQALDVDATPGLQMAADDSADRLAADVPAGDEKLLDDTSFGRIQRVVGSLLGAYSKLKLYPADGPVAVSAIGQVEKSLSAFFADQSVLAISRVDKTLLVNGVKVDTSGFEALAEGLLKFLSEVRLNSITFLKQVQTDDLTAFIAATREIPADDAGTEYWRGVAREKRIAGILFDEGVYGVIEAAPGAAAPAPEEPESEIEGLEMETPDVAEDLPAEPVVLPEEPSLEGMPERMRDLFLKGEMEAASALLAKLCDDYSTADASRRKWLLDLFDTVLNPGDWRPSADYIAFVLTPILPLFQDESDVDLIRHAAGLLTQSAEMFLLFGEYGLATWVFARLQQKISDNGGKTEKIAYGLTVFGKSIAPKIIDALIEDLKSEDSSRQQEVYQLLGSMGRGALPLLVDIIRRVDNLRVRRLAAALVKNIGEEGGDFIRKSLMGEGQPDERARILDVIDSVTTDLTAELTYNLSDPKETVRRAAFRLAERINTPEVLRLLIEYAKSDDPDLAVSAINSLGKLKAAKAARPLMQILDESASQEVLLSVCRAMGQIYDPSFIPALAKVLMPKRRNIFRKKYDTPVRIAAAYAISQMPDERGATLLKALANDPDVRLREVAKRLNTHRQ